MFVVEGLLLAFILLCSSLFTIELLSVTIANEIACRIMRRKGWNVGDYTP